MTPASRVLLIRIRGKGVPTPSRQSSEPYWRFPKESANVECKRGIKRLLLFSKRVPWGCVVRNKPPRNSEGGYLDQVSPVVQTGNHH